MVGLQTDLNRVARKPWTKAKQKLQQAYSTSKDLDGPVLPALLPLRLLSLSFSFLCAILLGRNPMALSCPTYLVLQHRSLLQLQWPLRAPCLLRTFVQGLPIHTFSGLSSPSPQRKIFQPLAHVFFLIQSQCVAPPSWPACLVPLSNSILSSFIFCLGSQAFFRLPFSQVGSLAGGVLLLGSS